MRNISFAWTTPMLVTGNKTCTRREWKPEWATRFMKEDLLAAYDRQPRFKGKQVAVIRLTETPAFSSALPEEDYQREGFAFAAEHGIRIDGVRPDVLWRAWKMAAAGGKRWWVVRFEVLELTDYGRELAAKYAAAA